MSVLFNFYLGKKVIFPKENEVPWCQDFMCYPSHAPGDVEFRIDKFLCAEPDYRTILRAPGYGEMKNYGCGAICCDLIHILPYLIHQ